MVVSSELRTHKVMEAAIRELMGAGTPPRFKFKDTYASIEFPVGYTVPAQATLEAKYNELLALEEDIQKTAIEGDLEVGTSNLFVDTETGRVGIGTVSPIEKAHIYVDDAASGGQLFIENASTSNRAGLVLKNADGEGFNIQHASGSSNSAIIENFSTVNGGMSFYAKGDGEYGFRNTDSNTLRMVIKNNGNVGVGAITPQSKFHVDGDVRMKTLSTNSIGKITPVYARGAGNNNAANRLVKIGDTTHVNTSGRGLTLTIITASTHAHVSSTNYDTYASETASNDLATALEAMTDAQIGILTSYDAYEDDMTANLITVCYKLGLTRLAASADDLNRHPYAAIFYGPGVSTVPGNHALEVMKSDDASGAYATLSTFLIDDSFIGQTLTNALYSGTADSTEPTVIVDRYANVGIGKTNPAYKLDVTGDMYATGNITAYSDKRAKSDIKKIENALDKIEQLNGYTFSMNDKRYTGVIAQEVLPVLPEAVTGSEETNYAVAYGNMIGLLIEAIKELKQKIG